MNAPARTLTAVSAADYHPVEQVLVWAKALRDEKQVGAINGALIIQMLESYGRLLQETQGIVSPLEQRVASLEAEIARIKDAQIVIQPAEESESQLPEWPRVGQEFDVYVAAVSDPSDPPGSPLVLHLIDPPHQVANAISEVSGDLMTSDMFRGDLPDAPYETGLWKVRVSFFAYNDAESNICETVGFDVLSKESVHPTNSSAHGEAESERSSRPSGQSN